MARTTANPARRGKSATADGPDGEVAGHRYWNRLTQSVLLAGALAGAVTAVIGLRPAPDAADEAQVTSISVLTMPLSEYVRRSSDVTAQSAAAPGGQRVELAAFDTDHIRPTPVLTIAPAPSGSPSPTAAATSTSEPTSQPTSEPTSVTPTAQLTGGEPSDEPTPSTSTQAPTNGADEWVPSPDTRLSTLARSELTQQLYAKLPGLDRPPCDQSVAHRCVAYLVHASQVDDAGQPVSPSQAADRIIRMVRDARSGSHGQTLGVLVSANLEAVGLRGKDLQLTWSLLQADGAGTLPASWQHTAMSYLLRPSTDHDSGAVTLWVPLPKAKGTYVVQLTLRLDHAVLSSAVSPPVH